MLFNEIIMLFTVTVSFFNPLSDFWPDRFIEFLAFK